MTEPQPDPDIDPAFDDWEHRNAAKQINAIYSNQVFVQPLGDGMMRVNFGETMGDDEPKYHSAIVLSPHNALLFADLVARMARSLLPPPLVRNPAPDES